MNRFVWVLLPLRAVLRPLLGGIGCRRIDLAKGRVGLSGKLGGSLELLGGVESGGRAWHQLTTRRKDLLHP